ncbi:MAG TPA: hypothetical protein VJG32_02960 [Anaerolineae bacterium]|nr:hypothetical protein [Anaerolineae bacterium]
MPPSEDATFDICIIQPDGTGWQRLTSDEGNDHEPTWSLDGREIAFISNRSGRSEVYVMPANGGNQRRLTFVGGVRDELAWSPDGHFIAYTAEQDTPQVYKVDIRSLQVTQLTTVSRNFNPQWSPDNSTIAFVSDRDGNFEIYVMHADGTGQRNITNDPAYDENPAWVPDSAHLTFERARSNFNDKEIYTISTVEPNIQSTLTQNTADGLGPVWSPNGKYLAFVSDRPGSAPYAVFVASASQGQWIETRVANRNTLLRLTWSPDSSKIAFTSSDYIQGRPISQIWIANIDGSDLKQLIPIDVVQ